MRPRPSAGAARVLTVSTPSMFASAVKEAVTLLQQGQVVALPTETVYGLAANALDPAAVQQIYEIKGRPAHNPIIVHVASFEMARDCVHFWTEESEKLARAFWPGPLTLVIQRSFRIPSIVTAGGPTVGVRWPSHPIMQAVIHGCGFPLAAPSANLSNRLSPTAARHVARELGDRIPLIIDGGSCQVGIESTVIDVTTSPPRVLRPGMIHEPALQAVIGRVESRASEPQTHLRSPGLLHKHYSPRARLVIWRWADEKDLRQHAARSGVPREKIHIVAHSRIPGGDGFGRVSLIPHDPEAYGRALYAELHACDENGAELIVIEALPESPEWHGLADRLARAAA